MILPPGLPRGTKTLAFHGIGGNSPGPVSSYTADPFFGTQGGGFGNTTGNQLLMTGLTIGRVNIHTSQNRMNPVRSHNNSVTLKNSGGNQINGKLILLTTSTT
jgi:hypothetical protein